MYFALFLLLLPGRNPITNKKTKDMKLLDSQNAPGCLHSNTAKFILIFILVLLFLIPIKLIDSIIADRKYYQREAIASIIQPMGGSPEIEGMVVAVPYKQTSESVDSKGNKKIQVSTKYILFAPDTYNLDITVNPYNLTRGIFKVPVFNGKANVTSFFERPNFSHYEIAEKDINLGGAILIFGVSKTKNLTATPNLLLNGKPLSMSPVKYESVSPFTNSVYYDLADVSFDHGLSLTGEINFQGGENIEIRPIGTDNTITMTSNWNSPSFSGGWLPNERNITKDGFTAKWNIAGLSTVYSKSWRAGERFNAESVDVSFIVPVDAYRKTERSIKYALLFLIIPFIALLISEIFSKKRVHPIQYCLIGIADVIFYLLLLSISEHLSFDLTYLICAVCVSLSTLFYATAIFKKIKWGALLSCIQLMSYIFLYGTVQAEDYALLIGSLGMFTVVVMLMFITRKIDWYALNQKEGE